MIYRLQGTLQPYAWGGHDYIARLLGQPPDGSPKAELWFGDHPQGAALLADNGQTLALDQWLAAHPEALSAASRARFGARLPFLLKILDVRLPLSIQLHPDKAQAEAGFAREVAAQVPVAQRNYVDDNHKPESMVALSEFWLLHGFAAPEVIAARLAARPSLAPVAQMIGEQGLEAAYARVLRAGQRELAAWLDPLLDAPAPSHMSDNPDFWLHHTVRTMQIPRDALDAGLLSFYLLNIVQLRPGEGIFQPARLPHAYLFGQNVEIMAASNNVLRAGLTPKHMDIEELLRVIDVQAVSPAILPAPATAHGWHAYPAPVADYALDVLGMADGSVETLVAEEATVLLVLSGELQLTEGDARLRLRPGEAALLTAGSRCTLQSAGETRVVRASNH
ncbi:MAG: mannose-6-phosphate isomerase, class I [Cardiobacteriaceae bacterium]|nr:mannose-6-phosphate isomerase, class I [Cardiobacteriaceae bacterium]